MKELSSKIKFISIPKGLPTKIVADRSLLRSYVIYFQLKATYCGGIIFNFNRDIATYAEILNISQSKLRYYIKLLVKEGLVCYDDSKSLILRSRKVLIAKYNISKYCYRVKREEVTFENSNRKLEAFIELLALNENMLRQKHRLNERLLLAKLQDEGILKGNTSESSYKKMMRIFKKYIEENYKQIIKDKQSRFVQEVLQKINQSSKESIINPFIGLSRKQIAVLYGFVSHSTGSRRIKKLKTLGLVEKDISNKYFEAIGQSCSYDDYVNEIDFFKYKKVLNIQYKSGEIYAQIPNTTEYKYNFLFSFRDKDLYQGIPS